MLFQRHLGWQQKVGVRSLRFWLFATPGIITHPAGKTIVKLALPPPNECNCVVTPLGENPLPRPQLLCSRKPPCLRTLIVASYCTFSA